MTNRIVIICLIALSMLALTSCENTQHILNNNSLNQEALHSPSSSIVNLQGFPYQLEFWQSDTLTTWSKLQRVPLSVLQNAAQQPVDANIRAWLTLAIISKQYSAEISQLTTQLITWRTANPDHPANTLFPANRTLTQLQNIHPPEHITLLLPLQGKLSDSGQAVRDGFLSAYYNTSHQNQQTIAFLDTNQTQTVTALYQQALSQGADFIIGPLTKEDVQTLVKQGSFPTPTLALNYTDIWLGSLPANFYEFGLSPLDEAKQLAEKAWQTGHKQALVIAPQDEWGQRVTHTLISNWKSLGGTIADTLYLTEQTDLNQSIANLLQANINEKNSTRPLPAQQQRRQDFDTIFLLVPPDTARQVVPLLKYYYAEKIPIFSTSVIYSGIPTPQKDTDLDGVIFSDTPWTLQFASPTSREKNISSNRLYALGRDAYTLSSQINRLQLLPNFPIYGATGALTLTTQQQIYRRLAWTQMHNGHP